MNILFVDNHSPNPFDVQYGSIQRTNLLIQACAKAGHVDVAVLNGDMAVSNIENCDVIFCEVIKEIRPSSIVSHYSMIKALLVKSDNIFGHTNKEKECVVDRIIANGSYDYIVTRYIPAAVNCGLTKYGKKLVIDVDDSPASLWRGKVLDTSKTLHRWYNNLVYKKVLKMQKDLLRRSACGFFSNKNEVVPDLSVHLPNIPFYERDIDYCDFNKTPNNILFVGLVSYRPNLDGLNHFFDYVYPIIKQHIPDVTVSVVGRYDPSMAMEWKKDPSVTLKGFVDDLNAEYEQSRVAIVPIYSGAGTNIKILEAFRMKRPCVTTQFGSRGYDDIFTEQEDYWVSRSDEEYANNVISMLVSEEDNRRISMSAYTKVLHRYSKEAFFNIVKSQLY